ncbi:MAG: DNA cytosine methyltransferase [Oscillospiraceae bacterium]
MFYGCRAVVTPDREEKRQNGRRIKNCGEPSFTVTAQDRHGVLFQDCDECPYGMRIREATKQGYAIARCGDSINLSFPESKTQARSGSAKTLPRRWKPPATRVRPFAGCGLIRRLTPRECWRLQGFTDEMFDKARAVNSDNQLYRQAGNSVTIQVVYAVGRQILAAQEALEQGSKNDVSERMEPVALMIGMAVGTDRHPSYFGLYAMTAGGGSELEQ